MANNVKIVNLLLMWDSLKCLVMHLTEMKSIWNAYLDIFTFCMLVKWALCKG